MASDPNGAVGLGPDSPEPLISALLRPDAYPHPAADLTLHETHISWVILAGPYAYKIKKPLSLGFLDFSTLARRSAACEDEVRLNQRLAPSIYLGVVDIVRRDGEVHLGGAGAPIERAVWMRRLPDDGMLSHLLERGAVPNGLMGRIARLVAGFHSTAPTGPGIDQFAEPAAIAANWQENFDQVEPFIDDLLPSWELAGIRKWIAGEADRLRSAFEQRIALGRVREGHGDLHVGSACLMDGEPVLFDCLEFSARYRCSDVAAEVAFLAMDLDHWGRPDLGWRFVYEYVRASGDRQVWELLPFYKAYRAFVRAKVSALRAAQPNLAPEVREKARAEARSYFDLAASYAQNRPRLMAFAGLPGSGKSTLAEAVVHRLGMLSISSDIVRKQLAGLAPTQRASANFGSGIYDRASTRRTYARMRRLARRWLSRGVSVVLDGSFGDPDQRRLAIRLAGAAGAQFRLIHVTCDDGVRRQRLAARAHADGVTSDADWEIAERMRAAFVQPDELPSAAVIEDATGGADPDSVIGQLLV